MFAAVQGKLVEEPEVGSVEDVLSSVACSVCVQEDPHLGTQCMLMRDLCMKPHHIHNTYCKEWAKGECLCAYTDVESVFAVL